MVWELSWCDWENCECGGVCPCGDDGFVVEDWAESHWSEWFVILSCDHKIIVEKLFELLDLFELEFVLSGALLKMEWPLGVEKVVPLVLD